MRHLRTLRPLSLVAIALLAGPITSVEAKPQGDQPNILFIFADDQCFDTIHEMGNLEVETPNIDRLVKQGTIFTHAYNMGSWSGAVCIASRTMLNTGRFLWHANRVYGKAEEERAAGRFWSEHMKRAGYKTYMTGKWHVRATPTSAFDIAVDVRGGMPRQTPQGYNRPIEGKPDPWSPYDKSFGGFWEGGKHWSEVVGDHALEFIDDAKKQPQPFFMYVAFNAPHDPRQSPKEYVDRYPLDKIAVPKNFLPEYPYNSAMGCGRGLRDERLAPFPRTEYAVKVNRQEYYAIITHMDNEIGRILDSLEASGMADNTYIFFTADHGLACGQHGLMGKQNLFDHSMRVPFIIVGPDVEKGAKRNGAIYLQDVMPTSLELAGVDRPNHVQFKSLLPMLRDPKAPHYDAVYGAYLGVQRAVIQDDYKMIVYPAAKKILLFNLKNDPLEMNDLAGDPANRDLIRKLFATFEKLQKETGDSLDISSLCP